MKIPAFLQKWAKAERISVTFSAKPLKYGGYVYVKAIVDSGCPWTFISENDAERCRSISSRTLNFFERVNLGGVNVDLFDLGEVVFTLRDSENKTVDIKSRCFVGRLGQRVGMAVGLPSVIGMDFLKDKRGMAGFDENGNPCMVISKIT
jgi:hypothetical protein